MARLFIYQDYTINEEDAHSLIRHNWLTDNMVNFAIVYLADRICGEEKRTILIVDATQCELIKFAQNDELQTLLQNIGLGPTKWAIFIYNDTQNPDRIYSGTHWSLILFDPNQRQFLLIDPANYTGKIEVKSGVKNFTAKMQTYFGVVTGIRIFSNNPPMDVSGDCGIYIIEYARAIVANNEANPERDFDFLHTEPNYLKDGKNGAICARKDWQKVVKLLEETNKRT